MGDMGKTKAQHPRAKQIKVKKRMLREKKQPEKTKMSFVLPSLGFLMALGVSIWGVSIIIESNNFEHYKADQTKIFEQIQSEFQEFYQDEVKEIPVREISGERIEKVERELEQVTFEEYQEPKNEIYVKADGLYEFIAVRDEIDGYFQRAENGEEFLKSTVEIGQIEQAMQNFQALPEGHRTVLRIKVEKMRPQYDEMQNVQLAVRGLFSDEELTKVRENLKRGDYNVVKEQLEALPQQDIKDKWHEKVESVDKELTRREEELRRLAEEARRKREEERRRREAEIQVAWHVINVPYHSQNLQGIFNGCEAASLLMGLQAKGYLGGMDLRTYAEMMPKSEDPGQGFTHSIYDLEPKNVAHWIAPAPLASFGRSSSGANVVDISGASLDQLDAEVAAGNPVVIYLTYKFVGPKDWSEGAPRNLHVMLLTGFNAITGEQVITDPWTQSGGKRTWNLPKATINGIYNAVGRKAVVIR